MTAVEPTEAGPDMASTSIAPVLQRILECRLFQAKLRRETEVKECRVGSVDQFGLLESQLTSENQRLGSSILPIQSPKVSVQIRESELLDVRSQFVVDHG